MANTNVTTTAKERNYPFHRMVDMAHTTGPTDFDKRPIIGIKRKAKPVELSLLIQGRLTDIENVASALANGLYAEVDGMPALAEVLSGLIQEVTQAQKCLSDKLTEAAHD